jgi:hypothetical protein
MLSDHHLMRLFHYPTCLDSFPVLSAIYHPTSVGLALSNELILFIIQLVCTHSQYYLVFIIQLRLDSLSVINWFYSLSNLFDPFPVYLVFIIQLRLDSLSNKLMLFIIHLVWTDSHYYLYLSSNFGWTHSQ